MSNAAACTTQQPQPGAGNNDQPRTAFTTSPVSDICGTYGFVGDDTIPAFFRRENISCAHASIGLKKEQEEWDKNCSSISRLVYERIKPALRIAGAMMLDSEKFFAKILFADIKRLEHPHQANQGPELAEKKCHNPGFDAPYAWQWNEFDAAIRVLPSRLRIFMGRDEVLAEKRSHGRLYCEWNPPPSRLSMHINAAYLAFFGDWDYEFFNDEIKNRILFQLAVTLVHEMAHMMWFIRYASEYFDFLQRNPKAEGRPAFDPNQPEPLFTESVPEIELGRAWEHYMFGGITDFLDEADVLGPRGNLLYVERLKYSFKHSLEVEHDAIVLGEWLEMGDELVNAFFDDRTYQMAWYLKNEAKKGNLQVPKDMDLLQALFHAINLRSELKEQQRSEDMPLEA